MQRNLRHSITVVLALAAVPAWAQELTDSPFFKLKTTLPNAIEMQDGDLADANISYFANAAGSVEGASLEVEITTFSTIPCRFDPGPPVRIVCTGPGVNGEVVEISFNPVTDQTGFDLSLEVQQAGLAARSFMVPGIEFSEDGVPQLRGASQ